MKPRLLEDSKRLTLLGVLGLGRKLKSYHPGCLVKSCREESAADGLHTLKRDCNENAALGLHKLERDCNVTRENVHYRYPDFDERVCKAYSRV